MLASWPTRRCAGDTLGGARAISRPRRAEWTPQQSSTACAAPRGSPRRIGNSPRCWGTRPPANPDRRAKWMETSGAANAVTCSAYPWRRKPAFVRSAVLPAPGVGRSGAGPATPVGRRRRKVATHPKLTAERRRLPALVRGHCPNLQQKPNPMGQAKRRGTFEERRQQAMDRHAELCRQSAEKRRLEREAEDARIDAMSDEERRAYYARQNRRMSAGSMIWLAAAMAMPMAMGGRRR